jgi:hypothetical protein
MTLTRAVPLLAALLLAAPGPAVACTPGSLAACPPGIAPDPRARLGPLTRDDLNARIGTPGPPVADEVARDTARTWEAVRRQSQEPVIAYPRTRPHMRAKGEMP